MRSEASCTNMEMEASVFAGLLLDVWQDGVLGSVTLCIDRREETSCTNIEMEMSLWQGLCF